ncbi:MAG TPA: cytidine deaminase [Clostridiales bacterium]|nr:cytidine deaminase [Clostridiales bacterium]
MKSRPSWDAYFLGITWAVASRSTCLRRQVGAIVVRDKRILTTGYNGAPAGLEHCGEAGCMRERLGVPSGERHDLCRGLHAEQNALVQAALHGISVQGSTLYCTSAPCVICAKMLINAGVRRVVFVDSYPDQLAHQLLEEAGVEFVRGEGPVELREHPNHRSAPTQPPGTDPGGHGPEADGGSGRTGKDHPDASGGE